MFPLNFEVWNEKKSYNGIWVTSVHILFFFSRHSYFGFCFPLIVHSSVSYAFFLPFWVSFITFVAIEILRFITHRIISLVSLRTAIKTNASLIERYRMRHIENMCKHVQHNMQLLLFANIENVVLNSNFCIYYINSVYRLLVSFVVCLFSKLNSPF